MIIYFHAMQEVCCLALQDVMFCLRIVACDVSVSFLNACYFALTKKINLS